MSRLLGIKSYFGSKTRTATAAPYLIVGLGNPGRQFRHNRHNIGFLLLDQLSERLEIGFSRLQSKALVGKTIFREEHIILAKPQTYMNLSGQSVSSLVHFYKIPLDKILVVFDDVDLPFGALRIRPGGGAGGHKGMGSIIERLASEEIPRLRLGINRPPGRMEAADYVLQDFSKDEQEMLGFTIDRAVEAVITYLAEGLETAMNRFNGKE